MKNFKKMESSSMLFESIYKKLEAQRAESFSALLSLFNMEEIATSAIRKEKSLSEVGINLLQQIVISEMSMECLKKYFTESETEQETKE